MGEERTKTFEEVEAELYSQQAPAPIATVAQKAKTFEEIQAELYGEPEVAPLKFDISKRTNFGPDQINKIMSPRYNASGMLEIPNLDMTNRPSIPNPAAGGNSSVFSRGFNIDGKEVLLPTVIPDGKGGWKLGTDDEAIAEYQKTGKHLGVYASPEASTAASKAISVSQGEKRIPPQKGLTGAPIRDLGKDLRGLRLNTGALQNPDQNLGMESVQGDPTQRRFVQQLQPDTSIELNRLNQQTEEEVFGKSIGYNPVDADAVATQLDNRRFDQMGWLPNFMEKFGKPLAQAEVGLARIPAQTVRASGKVAGLFTLDADSKRIEEGTRLVANAIDPAYEVVKVGDSWKLKSKSSQQILDQTPDAATPTGIAIQTGGQLLGELASLGILKKTGMVLDAFVGSMEKSKVQGASDTVALLNAVLHAGSTGLFLKGMEKIPKLQTTSKVGAVVAEAGTDATVFGAMNFVGNVIDKVTIDPNKELTAHNKEALIKGVLWSLLKVKATVRDAKIRELTDKYPGGPERFAVLLESAAKELHANVAGKNEKGQHGAVLDGILDPLLVEARNRTNFQEVKSVVGIPADVMKTYDSLMDAATTARKYAEWLDKPRVLAEKKLEKEQAEAAKLPESGPPAPEPKKPEDGKTKGGGAGLKPGLTSEVTPSGGGSAAQPRPASGAQPESKSNKPTIVLEKEPPAKPPKEKTLLDDILSENERVHKNAESEPTPSAPVVKTKGGLSIARGPVAPSPDSRPSSTTEGEEKPSAPVQLPGQPKRIVVPSTAVLLQEDGDIPKAVLQETEATLRKDPKTAVDPAIVTGVAAQVTRQNPELVKNVLAAEQAMLDPETDDRFEADKTRKELARELHKKLPGFMSWEVKDGKLKFIPVDPASLDWKKPTDAEATQKLGEFEAAYLDREKAHPKFQVPAPKTPAASDRRHGVVPVQAEHRTEDRRTHPVMRKKVAEMSPEEMKTALLASPIMDLPNVRSFDEDQASSPATHVAFADLDNFKDINSLVGHDGGDVVLRAIGDVIRDLVAKEGKGSIRAYHKSGDEVLVSGNDPKAINEFMGKVRDAIKATKIEVEDAKGVIHTFNPGVSYGVGKDPKSAEVQSDLDKARRREAGLRHERNEGAGISGRPASVPPGKPGLPGNQGQRPVLSKPKAGKVASRSLESLKASHEFLTKAKGTDPKILKQLQDQIDSHPDNQGEDHFALRRPSMEDRLKKAEEIGVDPEVPESSVAYTFNPVSVPMTPVNELEARTVRAPKGRLFWMANEGPRRATGKHSEKGVLKVPYWQSRRKLTGEDRLAPVKRLGPVIGFNGEVINESKALAWLLRVVELEDWKRDNPRFQGIFFKDFPSLETGAFRLHHLKRQVMADLNNRGLVDWWELGKRGVYELYDEDPFTEGHLPWVSDKNVLKVGEELFNILPNDDPYRPELKAALEELESTRNAVHSNATETYYKLMKDPVKARFALETLQGIHEQIKANVEFRKRKTIETAERAKLPLDEGDGIGLPEEKLRAQAERANLRLTTRPLRKELVSAMSEIGTTQQQLDMIASLGPGEARANLNMRINEIEREIENLEDLRYKFGKSERDLEDEWKRYVRLMDAPGSVTGPIDYGYLPSNYVIARRQLELLHERLKSTKDDAERKILNARIAKQEDRIHDFESKNPVERLQQLAKTRDSLKNIYKSAYPGTTTDQLWQDFNDLAKLETEALEPIKKKVSGVAAAVAGKPLARELGRVKLPDEFPDRPTYPSDPDYGVDVTHLRDKKGTDSSYFKVDPSKLIKNGKETQPSHTEMIEAARLFSIEHPGPRIGRLTDQQEREIEHLVVHRSGPIADRGLREKMFAADNVREENRPFPVPVFEGATPVKSEGYLKGDRFHWLKDPEYGPIPVPKTHDVNDLTFGGFVKDIEAGILAAGLPVPKELYDGSQRPILEPHLVPENLPNGLDKPVANFKKTILKGWRPALPWHTPVLSAVEGTLGLNPENPWVWDSEPSLDKLGNQIVYSDGTAKFDLVLLPSVVGQAKPVPNWKESLMKSEKEQVAPASILSPEVQWAEIEKILDAMDGRKTLDPAQVADFQAKIAKHGIYRLKPLFFLGSRESLEERFLSSDLDKTDPVAHVSLAADFADLSSLMDANQIRKADDLFGLAESAPDGTRAGDPTKPGWDGAFLTPEQVRLKGDDARMAFEAGDVRIIEEWQDNQTAIRETQVRILGKLLEAGLISSNDIYRSKKEILDSTKKILETSLDHLPEGLKADIATGLQEFMDKMGEKPIYKEKPSSFGFELARSQNIAIDALREMGQFVSEHRPELAQPFFEKANEIDANPGLSLMRSLVTNPNGTVKAHGYDMPIVPGAEAGMSGKGEERLFFGHPSKGERGAYGIKYMTEREVVTLVTGPTHPEFQKVFEEWAGEHVTDSDVYGDGSSSNVFDHLSDSGIIPKAQVVATHEEALRLVKGIKFENPKTVLAEWIKNPNMAVMVQNYMETRAYIDKFFDDLAGESSLKNKHLAGKIKSVFHNMHPGMLTQLRFVLDKEADSEVFAYFRSRPDANETHLGRKVIDTIYFTRAAEEIMKAGNNKERQEAIELFTHEVDHWMDQFLDPAIRKEIHGRFWSALTNFHNQTDSQGNKINEWHRKLYMDIGHGTLQRMTSPQARRILNGAEEVAEVQQWFKEHRGRLHQLGFQPDMKDVNHPSLPWLRWDPLAKHYELSAIDTAQHYMFTNPAEFKAELWKGFIRGLSDSEIRIGKLDLKRKSKVPIQFSKDPQKSFITMALMARNFDAIVRSFGSEVRLNVGDDHLRAFSKVFRSVGTERDSYKPENAYQLSPEGEIVRKTLDTFRSLSGRSRPPNHDLNVMRLRYLIRANDVDAVEAQKIALKEMIDKAPNFDRGTKGLLRWLKSTQVYFDAASTNAATKTVDNARLRSIARWNSIEGSARVMLHDAGKELELKGAKFYDSHAKGEVKKVLKAMPPPRAKDKLPNGNYIPVAVKTKTLGRYLVLRDNVGRLTHFIHQMDIARWGHMDPRFKVMGEAWFGKGSMDLPVDEVYLLNDAKLSMEFTNERIFSNVRHNTGWTDAQVRQIFPNLHPVTILSGSKDAKPVNRELWRDAADVDSFDLSDPHFAMRNAMGLSAMIDQGYLPSHPNPVNSYLHGLASLRNATIGASILKELMSQHFVLAHRNDPANPLIYTKYVKGKPITEEIDVANHKDWVKVNFGSVGGDRLTNSTAVQHAIYLHKSVAPYFHAVTSKGWSNNWAFKRVEDIGRVVTPAVLAGPFHLFNLAWLSSASAPQAGQDAFRDRKGMPFSKRVVNSMRVLTRSAAVMARVSLGTKFINMFLNSGWMDSEQLDKESISEKNKSIVFLSQVGSYDPKVNPAGSEASRTKMRKSLESVKAGHFGSALPLAWNALATIPELSQLIVLERLVNRAKAADVYQRLGELVDLWLQQNNVDPKSDYFPDFVEAVRDLDVGSEPNLSRQEVVLDKARAIGDDKTLANFQKALKVTKAIAAYKGLPKYQTSALAEASRQILGDIDNRWGMVNKRRFSMNPNFRSFGEIEKLSLYWFLGNNILLGKGIDSVLNTSEEYRALKRAIGGIGGHDRVMGQPDIKKFWLHQMVTVSVAATALAQAAGIADKQPMAPGWGPRTLSVNAQRLLIPMRGDVAYGLGYTPEFWHLFNAVTHPTDFENWKEWGKHMTTGGMNLGIGFIGDMLSGKNAIGEKLGDVKVFPNTTRAAVGEWIYENPGVEPLARRGLELINRVTPIVASSSAQNARQGMTPGRNLAAGILSFRRLSKGLRLGMTEAERAGVKHIASIIPQQQEREIFDQLKMEEKWGLKEWITETNTPVPEDFVGSNGEEVDPKIIKKINDQYFDVDGNRRSKIDEVSRMVLRSAHGRRKLLEMFNLANSEEKVFLRNLIQADIENQVLAKDNPVEDWKNQSIKNRAKGLGFNFYGE